ncbi:MAG TPA: fused MFS/spermidine synthase [Amycolatopsis sp.]|uniref:spermidine synthase n=1 Tax=Amycolatopsis sp. TaxID=37632 RepID=UPI002B466300|nr:fused MFS/spermidine synthase [Amycolatopsis sp.]HKS46625.1 fused MFS/spermidine synthase [Amycolatopsis sp.]
MPGEYPVRFGMAELLADADWPGGWLLTVDGVAQSYVDLEDPTHLEFEYARRIGDVIDCLEPGPLEVLHLGGAGCTLPRYVAATRPGSRQLVFDADGELIDLVREQLDLRSVPNLRVRISDGREGARTRRDNSADLIVADVFQRATMPSDIATTEFTTDVARVLRASGSYLLNVADGPGLVFARRVAATVAEVFPHVALLAEPGVLRGRRFGNLVLAASAGELPVAELTAKVASAAFPARCLTGQALKTLCGNAKPITDEMRVKPPVPPWNAFSR